ncbi:unnamed protein product, partial [Prorocentrum cordatum]
MEEPTPLPEDRQAERSMPSTGETDRAFIERMFTKFDDSFVELRAAGLRGDMGKVHKQLISHQGQIDHGRRHMDSLDKHAEMGKRFADIEAQTAILKAEQLAAQKEIETLKRNPVPGPAVGGGPLPPRGPRWAQTPRNLRDIFVMTNLRWNVRDVDCERAARAFLAEVGADQNDISELKAPCDYGSLVEVKSRLLRIQKLAMNGLSGQLIWMGTISTKEERAPAKAWTGLKEQVPDVDKAVKADATVAFSDRSRQVYIDHAMTFRFSLGEVKWAACEEGGPVHWWQCSLKEVVAK